MNIAYFVSPHGYGHAARAAAVMAALHELEPTLRFEIFTRVPLWFFQDSLTGPFGYHACLTDIGLAQKNSLVEDVAETVRRLEGFLPFVGTQLEILAEQVTELQCRLVMCDIAPLGIAVARQAGLPAVLVENFTWDWIYEGYKQEDARLEAYITYLQGVFREAAYHIQTEPICQPQAANLVVRPISRKSRTAANQTRQAVGVPDGAAMVLLTMGGHVWDYTFLEQLTAQQGIYFVISGEGETPQFRDNLALLPHRSGFFHPDLVYAADAVIGKIGYSTLAEVYHAGVPFGYIERAKFREGQVLATYIQQHMHGLPIQEAQFANGDWVRLLPELLALPRLQRHGQNGAEQVANFVRELLDELG